MFPQHKYAEQSVLGLCVNEPEISHKVTKLNNDLFYEPKNKAIHLAIRKCVLENYGIDTFTIVNMTKTIKVKGLQTNSIFAMDLIELQENLPAKAQLPAYVKMLEEAQSQREILTMCQYTAEKMRDRLYYQTEIDEIVDGFKKSLFRIKVIDERVAEYAHITAVKTVEKMEVTLKKGRQDIGIPSGFPDFDEKSSGFRGGQLIIFCGRPGMGKTSLALDICTHASSPKPGCGFLSYFFSLEMSSEEISARLLSKLSGVNLKNLRTADLSSGDLKAISGAALGMVDYKLVIDDSPLLTPATIKAKIMERQALHEEKPDIIFIDYLQLLAPSQNQNSREREVASMSRDLKLLARELNIPVVVMSQLNRELEKRPNKRPIMADIRESGAVEQDADIIVALYQPFLYTNSPNDQGRAEAIILKQRNGPIGVIPMIWRPETSSFTSPLTSNGGVNVKPMFGRSGPVDYCGGLEVEYTCVPGEEDETSFPETVNNEELPF